MPRPTLAEVTRDSWEQVQPVQKIRLVYNNEAIGLGWANSENMRANGPTICKRSISKLPGLWPYGIIVDLRTQADGLG